MCSNLVQISISFSASGKLNKIHSTPFYEAMYLLLKRLNFVSKSVNKIFFKITVKIIHKPKKSYQEES